MGQVAVTINAHDYKLNCDDGEEERIAKLAAFIDERAAELAGSVGDMSEMRLMVMTNLVTADRLFDAEAEIERLRAQLTQAKKSAATEADATVAPLVETIARRIDDIADRLENA